MQGNHGLTVPLLLNKMKLSGSLASVTTLTMIIGLFSTVTNLIPLSVLPFAWLALLLPLSIASKTKITKITAWAILYYFVSLTSLLIYDPSALINWSFYRYDGNFLISFLPLLLLPTIPHLKIKIESIVKKFVLFSVVASLPPSVYQFISVGYSSGLFVAHNAFGGFLMSLIAFSFSWLIFSKFKLGPFIVLLLSVGLLILSASRGSLLGIALGIISYLSIRYSRKWLIAIMISVFVITQFVILVVTYPIYLENKDTAYNLAVESADSAQEANIYIRAYENWPRGIYLFSKSPLFGTGVGSANDFPLKFDDDLLIQMNSSNERNYDSAHAHNTYIHILGEQGAVGLFIFLLMWSSIHRYLQKRTSMPMIRDTLIILFWSLTFSSFTEHRIPSPSNAFPFIILFAMYYSTSFALKTQHSRLHSIV